VATTIKMNRKTFGCYTPLSLLLVAASNLFTTTVALDLDVNFAVASALSDETSTSITCRMTDSALKCSQKEAFKLALDNARLSIPGLLNQIDAATTALTDVDPNQDLFFLFAGGNDFLGPYPGWAGEMPPSFVSVASPNPYNPFTAAWTVNNLGLAMEKLHSELGAKHILTAPIEGITLFPLFMGLLASLPTMQAHGFMAYAAIWEAQFSAGLTKLIDDFNSMHPGSVQVTSFNFMGAGLAQIGSGALTGGPTTCRDTLYSDPSATYTDPEGDGYECPGLAFMDLVHPTTEFWEDGARQFASNLMSTMGGSSPYRRLITFGDSLSDVGSFQDIYARTTGLPFFQPPYFGGRNVNGYTLPELIEQHLGLPASTWHQYPASCMDRPGKWTNNGIERNWCKWAKKRLTKFSKVCKNKNLYIDCPKTCGACTS